jgi:adenine phosphoribosyltransferase
MKDYLRLIDTDTTGPRYDVTPLFADPEAFSSLVEDLLEGFAGVPFDLIAGIDALGFILGAAMAMKAGKGLVPVRKCGKLPVNVDRVSFIDYTGEKKALEIRPDAIDEGVRVLVVDEWIETGAQVSATVDLIEGRGGVIVGIASIAMDENPRTDALREKYPYCTVWEDGLR